MSTDAPSTPHPSAFDGEEAPGPAAPPRGPRYVPVARVGVGGMGRVWLARDTLLGREVALKELLDPTPALETRLRQEVALTASLDHPGIVPVYDLERSANGRLSAVMRLVRGTTLTRWLARGPSLEARVRRVAEAAHAVAFAHARGVVHRDLKPDNILVEDGGAAQVTDWGLARRVADGPAQREGTEGFLAPEVSPGAVPQPSADVFSLGRVLQASLGPRAPAELAAVIAHACAARPEARYADAGAFAAELEAWLAGREVQAYAYGPAERLARLVVAWRAPLIAAGVVLALAFVGLWFAWLTAARERDRARAAEAAAHRHERHLLEAQAVAAAQAGALPEAEVLAAHALALGPSPAARGLLAALAVEPIAGREVRGTGPRCAEEGLFDAGGWCRQPTGTRLRWRGQVWDTPLRVQQARAGGPWLVLLDEEDQLWLVTEAWPGGTWLGPARPLGIRLELDAGAGLVLSADRGWVSVYDLRRRVRVEHRAPCDDVPLLATWLEDGTGRLHHVCADGQRLSGWPGGVLLPVHPPLPAARAASILTVASRAGVVLFGTTSGELWRLGPDGVEVLHRLHAPVAVAGLQLSADGALALLVPAEGNAVVVDAVRGQRMLTLPRGAASAARFEDETLVTRSAGAEVAWSLPPVRAPAVLRAERGLATLAFTPDGEALVAGGADGHVRRWSLLDGSARDAPLGWQRTVKAVATSGEVLFAGGIDEEALVELDARTLVPRRRWVAGTRIKQLGLGPDGVPWALGYHVGPVRWTHEGALARADEGRSWRDGAGLGDGRAVWLDASGGLWLADGASERRLFQAAEAQLVGGHPDVGLVIAHPTGLRLFDLEGRERWSAPLAARASSLRVTARWVLAGTVRGEVVAYDAGGTLVAVHRGHEGTVSALAVNDDATELASAGWDARVRRWALSGLGAPIEPVDVERRWGLTLETALLAR